MDPELQQLISGLDIETAGAEYAGLDIETAGAEYASGAFVEPAEEVAGAEMGEMLAEAVSGLAVRKRIPLSRALAALPPQLQGLATNALRRRAALNQRDTKVMAAQPRLVDPGPQKWFETEEGFGPVNVLAGATSPDIIIQPDVIAFRPITLFVDDDVASYFRLVYWYVGRHNALLGSGKIPCTRFKSTATVKKWRLPTIRSGGRLILRFENRDAADHPIEGSVSGLAIE